MTLDEYLIKYNITAQEFYRKSGIYPSHLSLYIRKKSKPSAKNLAKIIRATSGEVTAEDFIDETAAPLS